MNKINFFDLVLLVIPNLLYINRKNTNKIRFSDMKYTRFKIITSYTNGSFCNLTRLK